MKKHRIVKVVVITAASLILLELILSIGLVFFAIGSFGGMESIQDAPRKYSEENRALVERNIADISAKTEAWFAETDVSEVSITADDGAVMYADMVGAADSHRWVILLHGYKRTRERVRNYGRFYAEQGFNLVMPDLRGHGKSGGAFIGMGWLDRKDIIKWTEYIVSLDPDAQIVLHGISMGGAAAMMTAGEELCPNVKAVVDDCGYTSVWEQFSNVTKSYTGLPDFPLMYTASFFAKLLAGYSYEEASSLEQVKKSTLPILFIHGKGDTFVYPEMTERLYAAHPNGELLLIDDAAHGQAMYFAPDTYFAAVFSFIDRYIE
ncbi:MAG: alpha/beta fold hydrolase [Ruminiclostridium sp.]|nr:alpha/beta fold hydrolase [Ruminiclostridium sp.]